jgi:hypothetical protein
MAFCPRTRKLPSGSPKIPTTRTPAISHNFACRPPIAMRSKKTLQLLLKAFQWYVARCLDARKLGRFQTFNGWESNCQFNSWPFFGHNLCFKCPNGQCKPILDIYTLITFQWYKELFKVMSFGPFNCILKVRESIWDSNSQHGSSLGSVRVHSLTLFAFPGTCDVIPKSPSWPATLQPLTLVASPTLRLRQ